MIFDEVAGNVVSFLHVLVPLQIKQSHMLHILSRKLQTQIKMSLHRMQTPITSPSPLVFYVKHN